MKKLFFLVLFASVLAGLCWAEPARPLEQLTRMPVREVTVFKDGHAFVLHEGMMPVNQSGDVVLDYLPCPVIGTFWPFSADKRASLKAVTAGQHKVLVKYTSLDLVELIRANIGAEVMITEKTSEHDSAYKAIILDIPERSGEELEALSPPHSGEKLTQQSNLVLLKTSVGVKAVHLEQIQDITFLGEYKKQFPREEFRNLLSLDLDWAGQKPAQEAQVGLLYLQLGLRWIPNYRISLDGQGNARVTLQATLINELADLDDVTTHLVIGVPTFEFKETLDPISMQKELAELSSYFRHDARTAYGLSNAIMTQQVMPVNYMNEGPGEAGTGRTLDLGPEVAESASTEDLYVFTVNHITLRKGQRMVLTIAETTLPYEDVFSLDIPFAPPAEVWRHFDSSRQAELARLFSGPKVHHKIRLSNKAEYPLTTAPALILRDERVLAQGLMTYTAAGAETDLNITAAVNIQVKKQDNEVKRIPNAVTWQGDQYGRIDLKGTITLTSFQKKPIEVEVIRHVIGNVESVSHDGRIEMVNVFEDASFSTGSNVYPYWWGWFSWPWWWSHFNGIGRITWTVQLEPDKPFDLLYSWNYYWR
ncbi:hypothetical protein JXQ70_10705 [bacterium]|nr:hypothetical protein [bacterium]